MGPNDAQRAVDGEEMMDTLVLRKRVREIEPGIFYYKEVPVQSLPQIDVMFDELLQLKGQQTPWYLIVDLTETEQPSAEVREHLRTRYLQMEDPALIALVIGNNLIMRIVARFVAGRTLKMPYCVVDTLDAGLKRIKEASASQKQN